MKRKQKYDVVLFALLATLSFMPLLQQYLNMFKINPLNGKTVVVEKPKLNFETYTSGVFSSVAEAYVGGNFGFREPIIRLYNQYLWDFYGKTYANDVVGGKQGWLFYPQHVSDYYGTELLRWQPSVEEAKQNLDREVKYLNWARTILKDNGVELLVFMAPEKGQLYPEYLPEVERDTTTFNACDYVADCFDETGFPYIEMTRWFKQMKDSVPYLLIPQTGGHWNFSSVIAADSLFRYMGELKGMDLPNISIGELHPSDKSAIDAETDLEQLLNLAWPIRKRTALAPEAEVRIVSSPSATKLKVLFVGNSFFWRISHYIPLEEMFDEVEFWYYFSTAYYGRGFSQTTPVANYNLLEKLLDFDYVVWFATGNQLCKGTSGFADQSIVALTVSDSLMIAHAIPIVDSLRNDTALTKAFDTLSPSERDEALYWRATQAIKRQPTLIPQLRGDSLTIRNEEIPYAKIAKDIKKDSIWMAALEAQAFLRGATMKMMLYAEAEHIMHGKPLYKNQTAEIQFSIRCQEEVRQLAGQIPDNLEFMEFLKKNAETQGKTMERTIEDAAEWLIREQYGLHGCSFIDDSEAEIPLPADFPSPITNK